MNSTYNISPVDIPSSLLILKSICLGILVVLNILFNSVTLVVLRRMRELSPTTKVFLTSMTASDIAILIHDLPIFVCTLVNRWPFGDNICALTGYLSMASGLLYYLHLPVVNIDRFLAVSRPYRYPSLVTVPRARVIVVCLWCICFVVPLGIMPSTDFRYLDIYHICAAEMTLGEAISMAVITISPIILAIVVFLRLFLVARVHAAAIDAQERDVGNNDRSNDLERKTFTTFLIMTVCVTVCMTPQVFVYAILSVRDEAPRNYWLVCFVQVLAFSNTIINNVVYYWRTATFRKAFKDLILNH